MNTNLPWAIHFKIQPDKLESVRAALPAGASFLHACIEAGLINEDLYITWAKNHYKLPTLKATFFSQPPNLEFINRYRNDFPKYTIPILENEGTIFIACLEPVAEFTFRQPIQWILAPYSKLKAWAQIDIAEPKEELSQVNFVIPSNPLNGTVMAPIPKPDTSAPAINEDSHKAPTNPPEDIDFSKMEIPETKINISAPASDNPFEVKLDVAAEMENSFSVIAPLPTEPEPDAAIAPDGLVFPTPKEQPTLKAQPVPLTLTQDNIATNIPNLPEAPPRDDLNFSFSGAVPKMPVMPATPPPSVKPAAARPASNLTAKMIREDIAKSSFGVPTPPPPPAPEVDETPEIIHSEVAKQTLNKDAPQMAFSQMKVFFNQSMIFLFEDQKLKPWKQDGTWVKAPHVSDEIDLSTPSIFRIVAETKKPYHGHVIPNPINDAFFNAWNQGNYPEHITMCPLIVKNQLVGMIIGGTTKDKSKTINLDTMERIAQSLASDLQASKAA